MKHKTALKVQAALGFALVFWVALGSTAAYLLDRQPGWFAASVGIALFSMTLLVLELHAARWTASARQEDAQATVEAWPHVIALLEDLERIEPERAEMVEVVKLEMAEHLRQARIVADGRTLGVRELLRRKKRSS